MESIVKIKISQIDDFKDHPFLVNDDDELKQLANSIKENGLLNPIIVRPKKREIQWSKFKYTIINIIIKRYL